MKKIDKYLDNKIYDDEDYLYDKTIKRIFKDYNSSIEYDYVVDENGYKYKSFERVVEDDGERYDLRNPSFTRYDSKAYYELSDVDFDDILDFDFIANATPEINNNVEANDTSKEIVLEKTSESISSKQTADCNESSSTTNNIKKEQTNEPLEKVSSSNKPKIEHATLWENYIHERKTNKSYMKALEDNAKSEISKMTYIDFPREYVDLREFDFNKFPKLNYVYYRNCKYVGVVDNPYLILVKANVDSNGNVILHPDTAGCAEDAFEEKDEDGNSKFLSINKLVLNEKFNNSVGPMGYCKIREVIALGYSVFYTYNYFTYFSKSECVVALKMKLSDYRDSSLAYPSVHGFLKYRNIYKYDEKIEQLYLKYIPRNYKKLLPYAIKHNLILEYFLEQQYLDQDDILYILEELDENSKIYNLVNEYKHIHFKNIKELDLEELFQRTVNENYTDEMNLKYAETIYPFDREQYLNIANEKKHITYMKTFLNEGDIFTGRTKDNKIVFLQVKKSKKLKSIFLDEAIKCLIKSNNLISNNNDLSLVESIHNICNIAFNNNLEIIQDKYTSNSELSYTPYLGLFRKTSRNGKVIEINYFDNSQANIITQEMYNLFDPFFYVDNRYYRKVESIQDVIYYIENYSELLLDCVDIKCSIMKPYFKIENIDLNYECKKGTIFNLKYILKYISNRLCVTDRTMNLNLINMEFNGSYPTSEAIIYKDITKEEIKEILDKYFYKEINRGYYHSCDTLIETESDFILYDRLWFVLFYCAVKQHKGPINSITDLKTLDSFQRIFNLMNIEKKYLYFFVEVAKYYATVNLFINKIEKFIIKNIDKL